MNEDRIKPYCVTCKKFLGISKRRYEQQGNFCPSCSGKAGRTKGRALSMDELLTYKKR